MSLLLHSIGAKPAAFAACVACLTGLLCLAVMTARAEPVRNSTSAHAFGAGASAPGKSRELLILNRTMRRTGCTTSLAAARTATCRQLQAKARQLSSELATADRVPRSARPSGKARQAQAPAPFSKWGDPNVRYRTMCVRLCDGFYYPVSEASQPANFEADEERCEASCKSPAKLFYSKVFYTSDPDAEAANMVALTGERYGDLPNAFRYRAEYNEACSCKPLPWTEEAKAAFHRRAIVATRNKLERIVAAGADEAAKALAAGDVKMARGKEKSSQAKMRYSEAVEKPRFKVRPRFLRFSDGSPPQGVPQRRFFLFRSR